MTPPTVLTDVSHLSPTGTDGIAPVAIQTPPVLSVRQLRREYVAPLPDVVEGLWAVGFNVFFAKGGLGKTMFCEAVEHHLAYGQSMGHWGERDEAERVRCLIFNGETDRAMVQEHSYLTMHELDSDTNPDLDRGRADVEYLRDDRGNPTMPGLSADERFLFLRAKLEEAAEAGAPFRYVRLDTLGLFLGSPPRGENPRSFEYHWSSQLNELATDHRLAVVGVHHTNKADLMTGSTGLGDGATSVIRLSKNEENPFELLVTSEKTRRGPGFKYALIRDSNGIPRFSDELSVSQAMTTGLRREVVDVLTRRGPSTMYEIQQVLLHSTRAERETIRSAVKRLQGKDIVRYYRGTYELVIEHGEPPAVVELVRPARLCAVCNEEMRPLITQDQTTHPGCDREEEPAAPVEETGDVIVKGWNASSALMASVLKSTKHPIVKVVNDAELEQQGDGTWKATAAPWSLFHEKMDGQHLRWRNDRNVPADCTVSIIDRRKSYLSTTSSVPVAPNKLAHTGPDVDPLKQAGIFLIERVEWPHEDLIPHPLGWTADAEADDQGRIWVTSPHLEFLLRLHRDGLVAAPAIVDSWTGVRATNLFRPFGEEARTVLQSGDAGMIEELKRGYSRAIRSMWPTRAHTDWYRPDWLMSFEAEASIRNWIGAWKAVRAGETLLRMANTDATTWVSPVGADSTWAPAGYTIGPDFGQVHHKDDLKLHVLGPDGRRQRRTDGVNGPLLEPKVSPLTPEEFGRLFRG